MTILSEPVIRKLVLTLPMSSAISRQRTVWISVTASADRSGRAFRHDDDEMPLEVPAALSTHSRPTVPRLGNLGEEEPTTSEFTSAPTDSGQPTADLRPRGRREMLIALVLLPLAVVSAIVLFSVLSEPEAGSLVVRASPPGGVTFHFAGERVNDRSPLVRRGLAPGAYTVRVERLGFATWEQTVRLEAGAAEERDAKLERLQPAQLRIITVPKDARIQVNERVVTAKERDGWIKVPGGVELAVVVSRDGYEEVSKRFAPTPGGRRDEYIRLEPLPGSLIIDSEPRGIVHLNGTRVGSTPYENHRLDVKKRWRVRITRKGYRAHEQRLEFGARRTVEINAKLKKR